MNNRKRSILHSTLNQLESLSGLDDKAAVHEIIEKAISDVQLVADWEEEALDSMPESFRFSTRYDDISDNVSDLNDAVGELEILMEECQEMDSYDYGLVKDRVAAIEEAITTTIER